MSRPTCFTVFAKVVARACLVSPRDAERVAAAIEAELAAHPDRVRLGLAPAGELVRGTRHPRAAESPEALAAYLTERAEEGHT